MAHAVAQPFANQIHEVNGQMGGECGVDAFVHMHSDFRFRDATGSIHQGLQRGDQGFSAGEIWLQSEDKLAKI